jgi:hypothetical protein
MRNSFFYSTFLTFALCIALSSCTKLYIRAVGIKPVKQLSSLEIETFFYKENIQQQQIIEANPSKYEKLILDKENDTLYYKNTRWYIQNHIQPIQTICFDNESKKPVFAFFNCIAESKHLTKFTWNKNGELNTFPPKEYDSYKWTDTLFHFHEILETIHVINTDTVANLKNNKDFTILVFFSLFFEKQSINLIKETREYIEKFIPGRYEVFFINFDNATYYMNSLEKSK